MASVTLRLWQQILAYIREHNDSIVQPWFNSLEAVQLDNGVLEIQADSPVHEEYLQKQAKEAFARAAQTLTGRLVGVRFVNGQGQNEAPRPGGRLAQSALYTAPKNDYTFDSFVVGRSNRLAHAACVAVSESPGQAYNPLFIHGSAGLGKTHLMQAVCQEVLRRDPTARVLFLTCETFIHHFIEGVEKGDLHNFRYRY